MKKAILFLFLAGLYSLSSSQIVYLNSFDTPADKSVWTQYRIGDPDSHDWEFVSGNAYSPPDCLYHDYPMDNGITYVEDWLVSPALHVSLNGLFSVFVSQNRMSNPPAVYFGIWFSNGSKEPADGDYVELVDLTEFPFDQNTWDDTVFQLQVEGDTSYIAFKYTAGYFEWLILWVDDLAITGAYPVGVEDYFLNESDLVNVYPNPFSDYCIFRFEGDLLKRFEDHIVLKIYDSQGKIVRRFINPGDEILFEKNDLKEGIYYYSLESDNINLASGKLLIN